MTRNDSQFCHQTRPDFRARVQTRARLEETGWCYIDDDDDDDDEYFEDELYPEIYFFGDIMFVSYAGKFLCLLRLHVLMKTLRLQFREKQSR